MFCACVCVCVCVCMRERERERARSIACYKCSFSIKIFELLEIANRPTLLLSKVLARLGSSG